MRRIHFLPTNVELKITKKETQSILIKRILTVEPINKTAFFSLFLEIKKDSDSTVLNKRLSSYKLDSEIIDFVHIGELIENFKKVSIKIISPVKRIDFFIEMIVDDPSESSSQ